MKPVHRHRGRATVRARRHEGPVGRLIGNYTRAVMRGFRQTFGAMLLYGSERKVVGYKHVHGTPGKQPVFA